MGIGPNPQSPIPISLFDVQNHLNIKKYLYNFHYTKKKLNK